MRRASECYQLSLGGGRDGVGEASFVAFADLCGEIRADFKPDVMCR